MLDNKTLNNDIINKSFNNSTDLKESLAEAMSTLPQGIEGEEPEEHDEQISYFKKRAETKRSRSKDPSFKSKDWIKNKKERQKRQGRDVREDSKYSGRKRKGRGVY